MDQRLSLRSGRFVTMAALLAASALLCGCQVFGYGAYIAGGGTKTVAAEYDGLAGKTVAVLVAADEDTLYAYANIADEVCRTVSSSLASNVEGITMMDPAQIDAFQKENPFWYTTPHGDVINRLKVERLLIIDVVQFQTHVPGGSHSWQGQISANVDIVEAGAAGSESAYRATVAASYPPDGRVSLLDTDSQTMRFAMLKSFAAKLSDLFTRHKVVRW